jgi:hypothetical protein
MLDEVVAAATTRNLLKPGEYVVCIMSQRGQLVVKVVQVRDGRGVGTAVPEQGACWGAGVADCPVACSTSVLQAVGGPPR